VISYCTYAGKTKEMKEKKPTSARYRQLHVAGSGGPIDDTVDSAGEGPTAFNDGVNVSSSGVRAEPVLAELAKSSLLLVETCMARAACLMLASSGAKPFSNLFPLFAFRGPRRRGGLGPTRIRVCEGRVTLD